MEVVEAPCDAAIFVSARNSSDASITPLITDSTAGRRSVAAEMDGDDRPFRAAAGLSWSSS